MWWPTSYSCSRRYGASEDLTVDLSQDPIVFEKTSSTGSLYSATLDLYVPTEERPNESGTLVGSGCVTFEIEEQA